MKRLLANKSHFSIIAILSLIAIFFLSINQIADFDTGYHLKTGQYIVENLSVPQHDVFSYSATGVRWIAHYWFSDIIFYVVHLLTGFPGLMIFVALISALTYYLVLKTALLKTQHSLIVPTLILVFFYFTSELWVVRPQIFSYLFTALLIFILELWREKKDIKILFWLPFIFLVWANMHAGVILGIAILGVYALGMIINKNTVSITTPLVLFFTSSLITLINPNGYKTLTYNFSIFPAVQNMNVGEWQSILHRLGTWQSKTFLILMLSSLILVWWSHCSKKKLFEIDWTSLALMSGFFIMPFVSIRHVGLFPIAVAPLVAAPLLRLIPKAKLDASKERLWKGLAGLIMVLLIINSLMHMEARPVINRSLLPVGAVDFIEANGIEGPMFNWGSLGGYLIWRLWPQELVFEDGRSEVFAGEPNTNLKKVIYGTPGWKEIVNEQYKVNYFIMWYREPISAVIKDWMLRTMSELDFKLVYWDDAAIILLRDTPENRNVINEYAYEAIHPFIHPLNIEQDKRLLAVEEIQRVLSISPDSKVLQNYLADFTR